MLVIIVLCFLSPLYASPPLYKTSKNNFLIKDIEYSGQSTPVAVTKSVYARGYYRKDGTYVRAHYRSPPTKRYYKRKAYAPKRYTSRRYNYSRSRSYLRRR